MDKISEKARKKERKKEKRESVIDRYIEKERETKKQTKESRKERKKSGMRGEGGSQSIKISSISSLDDNNKTRPQCKKKSPGLFGS